jgi:replication factor C subunit 3/5
MVQIMTNVCQKENIVFPDDLLSRIAKECEGNLRKALLILEATKSKNYPFNPNQPIEKTDWEVFISELATFIIQEQTPARLFLMLVIVLYLFIH